MKTTRIYLALILTFFSTYSIYAGYKLAILKDPDGFSNVRNGPGNDFLIVDTLYTDDFLYFQFIENSEWAKISAWKGRQIEGFIQLNKIQEVEKLENKIQQELIAKILNTRNKLKADFVDFQKSKDSLAYINCLSELKFYSDTKLEPILEILPRYICSTQDTKILQLFFASYWADKGSLNEMPSLTMASFFICNPDLVIKQLNKINSIEQKKSILNHIYWGLINYYGIEENGKTNNKEYNKHSARLDTEIKKINP